MLTVSHITSVLINKILFAILGKKNNNLKSVLSFSYARCLSWEDIAVISRTDAVLLFPEAFENKQIERCVFVCVGGRCANSRTAS